MPTYVLVWLTALVNPILYVACNATYRAVARFVKRMILMMVMAMVMAMMMAMVMMAGDDDDDLF